MATLKMLGNIGLIGSQSLNLVTSSIIKFNPKAKKESGRHKGTYTFNQFNEISFKTETISLKSTSNTMNVEYAISIESDNCESNSSSGSSNGFGGGGFGGDDDDDGGGDDSDDDPERRRHQKFLGFSLYKLSIIEIECIKVFLNSLSTLLIFLLCKYLL